MIREGFIEFAGYCHDNGARLIIVSAGLDFVIKHFVESMGVAEGLDIYSAKTVDEEGLISFLFPPLKMPGSRTFKDDLVRQCKADGNVVTYLGDGMPDTEACAISDNRFAVRGRRLETELNSRGLQFISFESFSEIMPTMARILVDR
jgi:2-hydroxy-3-keto-5-methylthiopentenyl-1-phosphate phosphatase